MLSRSSSIHPFLPKYSLVGYKTGRDSDTSQSCQLAPATRPCLISSSVASRTSRMVTSKRYVNGSRPSELSSTLPLSSVSLLSQPLFNYPGVERVGPVPSPNTRDGRKRGRPMGSDILHMFGEPTHHNVPASNVEQYANLGIEQKKTVFSGVAFNKTLRIKSSMLAFCRLAPGPCHDQTDP